jgi:tape measure domain-containing protein
MKSEDAHLAYLALSQMMSKGKVSSEELRRQLGERMPIAMEAMARAAGVTIQELDKLLKGGKLLSKDVILPFVKEMEKMLPEVNTDNIETSVARLGNTFAKLAKDLKIGDFYKRIVDGANKMLSNIQTSFARIALVIINSIAGAKVFGAFTKLSKQSSEANAKILVEKQRTELQMEVATGKRVAAEKNFANLSTLYNKASNDQKLQYYGKYVAAEKALDRARLNEKKALAAMEVAQAAKTTTVWATAWKSVKTAATTAFATIKVAMMSIVPMAIIGGITNVIMKFRELRKEAKEIKGIFSEYLKESEKVSTDQEYKLLESSLSVLKDKKSTQDEINNARSIIQSMLGKEIESEEKLLSLTNERLRILKDTAKANFYSNKTVSVKDEIDSIYAKYGGADAMDRKMRLRSVGQTAKKMWLNLFDAKPEIDMDYDRIQHLYKVLGDAEENLQGFIKMGVTPSGKTTATTTTSKPEPEEKETDLQKAEKKYAEEITKLTNQKEAEAISTKEYNKAIDALNKATYEEIAGILGVNAERNKTFQLAKKGVENQLSEDKLSEITGEYSKSLQTLNEKKKLGLISEEKYNSELLSLINATTDKIASLKNVGEAERQYIGTLNQMKSGLVAEPKRESRDTTFDYKKSESDKLSEELQLQEKYLQEIKEKYKELGDETVNALNEIAEAEKDVKTLSDALTLERIREDLENMNMAIFSEGTDAVTGFADALDRAVKSWERLSDKNNDMSSFERVVAVINAIGDTIKGLIGTMESYNDIQELISKRNQARQAQENAITAQKSANAATEAAASATVTAASGAETTAKTAEATANTAAAATGAAASVASIPIAGPAMAVAAVASVLAALSNLPKFANSGIVPGSSFSGDKVLARVNSGEMILNKEHQANLFKVLSGSYSGSILGNRKIFDGVNPNLLDNKQSVSFPKELKFEIEGRKLVGILKQEGMLTKRI